MPQATPLGGIMIEVVFFDVGNTLAARTPDGVLNVFQPGTPMLLRAMGSVLGLRLGVISNLPRNLTVDEFRHLLSQAELLSYFDPKGIVTNHEAGADKPDSRIYRFAAKQMGTATSNCLYVGEDEAEVTGAQSAGMSAMLKPFPPKD
jgi:FMN phosphatase YigB (HAD superfamily)